MSHLRTTIRNTIATLLMGLPTSGTHVFTSRTLIYQEHELPALTIATNDEDIADIDMHGQLLERDMVVLITAKAKVTENLDDVLDVMIAEVEEKIAAEMQQPTLRTLCKRMGIKGLSIAINEDGEVPIGEAVMRFNLIYFTNAQAPGVSI